jgi:hypothetical protein
MSAPEARAQTAAGSALMASSTSPDSFGGGTVLSTIPLSLDAATAARDALLCSTAATPSGGSAPADGCSMAGNRHGSALQPDEHGAEQPSSLESSFTLQDIPPAKQRRRAGSSSPGQAAAMDRAASQPGAITPTASLSKKRARAGKPKQNGQVSKRQTPLAGRGRLCKGLSVSPPKELSAVDAGLQFRERVPKVCLLRCPTCCEPPCVVLQTVCCVEVCSRY